MTPQRRGRGRPPKPKKPPSNLAMTDIDVVALAGKIITEPALPLGVRQRLAEAGAFSLTTSALQKHGPRRPGSAGRRPDIHKRILLLDIACALADADPRPEITASTLLDTLTGYAQERYVDGIGERLFLAKVYDAVLTALISMPPPSSDPGTTERFDHLKKNSSLYIGADLRAQARAVKLLL